MPTVIWTSEKFYNNSYILYLNSAWFYSVNTFLKNDVFLCNSMLVENSAIDNKNNNVLQIFKNPTLNNTTVFYNYAFNTIKVRLLLLLNCCGGGIISIDRVYKSASWLERESGEMFGIKYKIKTDTRCLLLDYTKQENPLLKDFPCGGFNDVFYSFFEDQVVINKATVIEI